MSTAGPATDVEFDAAAKSIRSESETLVRLIRAWPTVDPALYGDNAARSTSGDRLVQARGRVRAVASVIGEAATDCDRYAHGCREYYEAYRRYQAERTAYDAAWAAYEHARAVWSSGVGSTIVLRPSTPTLAATPATTPTTAPDAARAPEPVPPSLRMPSEPPCPPYCDPSPVR